MKSIYEIALGSDFSRLHPRIRQRFSLHSQTETAAVGRGVMTRMWYAKQVAFPFLHAGASRHLMFPQGGKQIPFAIENYAYRDKFGRETVAWIRTFRFPNRIRRFDATMIFSEQRGCIVDYMGTHQHLAVDLDIGVADNGGIRIRSGEQRFYEKWLQFRFPLAFSGIAEVCEWYDDKSGQYRIDVDVRNRWIGRIFGYSGVFEVEYFPLKPEWIPLDARPVREERRE
ncbi:DUF4166 domain-containing protein [Paenibacillus cisolokensis]|uniref:DUF4166 domain-containing protein n=1 Tax=Paenibacillus cisolokensis TaxID=1658519 RepID=UPI003D2D4F1B